MRLVCPEQGTVPRSTGHSRVSRTARTKLFGEVTSPSTTESPALHHHRLSDARRGPSLARHEWIVTSPCAERIVTPAVTNGSSRPGHYVEDLPGAQPSSWASPMRRPSGPRM